MNYLHRRRRWVYAILVGLLLVDAVAYVDWFWRPAVVPGYADAMLAQLQREVAAHEAEVARLRRIREELPRVRPALSSFTAEHFPAEQGGYSGVAAALADAARTAGVRLENVGYKVGAQQPRPDLLVVEVSTDLQGAYPNLLRYLEGLEQSPGFYLIDELSLVGSQRGGLRLQVRLVTYFRRSAS